MVVLAAVAGSGNTNDYPAPVIGSVIDDFKLPDADGAGGVTSFAEAGPSVVMFTAYDGDDDVFRATRLKTHDRMQEKLYVIHV